MRRARFFAALFLVLCPLAARAQEAGPVGELRGFSDWVVGCDNRFTCTAIGMVPDMASDFAYLRIERGPAPNSELALSIVALSQGQAESERTLRLSLDDGSELPAGFDALPADASGDYATAGVMVGGAALVKALLAHRTLAVTLDGEEPIALSLAGMNAALRWMDERQGRAGRTDALVAIGAEMAVEAPSQPPGLDLDAVALRELDPVPALPGAIVAANDDCNEFADPVAFARADDPQGRPIIAGRCSFSGAYNAGYSYFVLGDRAPAPLAFPLPGRKPAEPDADANVLVNATLNDDGTRITSFDKGRGISDCGVASEWAFDGTAARLSLYAAMSECRGVSPDDWPVLYRASTD